MKELEMISGKLPEMIIALYYPGQDKYVGVMSKEREAVPGLLVFESIIHLSLWRVKSAHGDAVPKILDLEEAREVVRRKDGFQSLILWKPPNAFIVEYI